MEKLNLYVDNSEGKEIIIREGQAPQLPPILPPNSIKINGTISSVANWLEKRKDDVKELKSHVLYDLDKGTLALIIDEANQINTKITGILQVSEVYKKLGINEGGFCSPQEMGKRLKKNRYYFESESIGMLTIAGLMKFSATVIQNHAREQDYSGSSKHLQENILGESTLPMPFNLKIPLFKGEEHHIIECEFEFDSEKMQVSMVSPQANKKIQDVMETRIGLELEKIAELSPEIPQIQSVSDK